MKIFEITEAKVEMCPEACCGQPVTECKCGPDCEHCDCYNKNKEDVKEGFLSNLVGDVRNAFKPGVQVTPNMVKELEAGLAAIKAGGQPTPRQQKIFDRFMSDTLAKELKKMGMSEASKNVSESPLAAWPAVAYAASRIPPTTYAGAATAIGTTIAKAIKHFEELIKKNPKHPKVSEVKAELDKLKPMLAKSQPEMAEGWFSGDILPAPKWLNDENNALWQKIQPTTKDKRLVKQLKKLQRFIKAGLTDQANQVVAKELSMMQREGIEESKKRKKRLDPKCWKGYRKDGTKMKGGTRVNNCVKVSEDEYTWEGDLHMLYDEDDLMEADYQGRNVKLGKPMQGDVKKFKVYVKNPKGNVVKVNFGHGGSSAKGKTMSIKKNNPGARKSFRARHNCDSPGPRHKARYWSCRKW